MPVTPCCSNGRQRVTQSFGGKWFWPPIEKRWGDVPELFAPLDWHPETSGAARRAAPWAQGLLYTPAPLLTRHLLAALDPRKVGTSLGPYTAALPITKKIFHTALRAAYPRVGVLKAYIPVQFGLATTSFG